MTSVRRPSRVSRFLGLAGTAVLLTAPCAWAGVEPTPFRTGLFGVTTGQAVRISVVNTGGTRSLITPCFRVLGADGRLLAEIDGGALPDGAGTSVEFVPVPDDGIPASRVRTRVQLRVEVGTPVPDDGLPGTACLAPVPDDGQPVPEDGQPPPEDGEPIPDDGLPVGDGGKALRRLLRHVIPALEVFDVATGRTLYTMPFAWAGVEPTAFRTGLFGVTAGEAVRISALNTGAMGTINPCFRIRDASGSLLFETDGGPLPRGVGTAVEFGPVPDDGIPTIRVLGRRRVQLRAEMAIPVPDDGLPGPGCLTPVPEDGQPVPDDGQPIPDDGEPARGGAVLRRLLRNVIPTLEVFDIATGRTIYTMPFAVVAGVGPTPF